MNLRNIHFSEISNSEISAIPGRGDLRIVLTSKCNLKCSHCHNEGNPPPWLSNKNEIDLSRIEELLSVAASHGARSVKFTGGDPTLHPDFIELLSTIGTWRRKFASVAKWGISTNGLSFLKEKYFQALVESELDNVCIGIDSIDTGDLSKPSSKDGILGSRLFSDLVQRLATQWPDDRSIKVNVVFDGDATRVSRVVEACIAIGVNASVIELNGVMGTKPETRTKFKKLYQQLRDYYSATEMYNQELNEFTLSLNNRRKISFYQDHCADLDCGHCRNVHLRISSAEGELNAVPCFLQDQNGGFQITAGNKVCLNRFKSALNLNGRGPEWKVHAVRYEIDDT
jgi:molybdenum cofactor biosynthesis enzyme MoaA